MWYVTMTDKFLSGWGHAEGRISKVVVECETHQQAIDVQSRNQSRSDMNRVNVTTSRPRYSSTRYHVDWRKYDPSTNYRF